MPGAMDNIARSVMRGEKMNSEYSQEGGEEQRRGMESEIAGESVREGQQGLTLTESTRGRWGIEELRGKGRAFEGFALEKRCELPS